MKRSFTVTKISHFKKLNNISLTILTAILLFLSCITVAQEQIKTEKDGFVIHAGIGTMFGGAGAAIEYQMSFSEKVKLSPFFGIGTQKISTEIPGNWTGFCFGANLEYGKIHFDNGVLFHWILGFNYGSQGAGYDIFFFNPAGRSQFKYVHKHLLVGPSFIGGYRFINKHGLIWQFHMGLSCIQNSIVNNKSYSLRPTGGFAVGYKFNHRKCPSLSRTIPK